MKPECSNAIRRLHSLLQQVAAEVAAIRPLLEEEEDWRLELAEALHGRLNEDHGCAATYASDREASNNVDLWAADAMNARHNLAVLARCTSALDDLAAQADLAAWMLANRSTVFELSSDDDSRVCALADAARSALPNAPRYALDATARAVLALPAELAYPVIEVPRG